MTVLPRRQRIRDQTFVVVLVSGLLLYLAWGLVTWLVIAPRFATLELEDANANLGRVHEVIDQQTTFLVDKTLDWGAWNDAYDWATGVENGFVASNLVPETCVNLNIHGLAYIAWDGRFIGRCQAGPTDQDPFQGVDLGPAGAILARCRGDGKVSGLVTGSTGPLLIAANRITKADGGGESPGIVLLARRLDAPLMTKLSEITRLKLRVSPWQVDDGGVDRHRDVDARNLESLAILRGIDGGPLLTARVANDRRLSRIGHDALVDLWFGGAVVGLVLALVTIAALELLFMRRLLRLEQEVASAKGDPERITIDGRDELASLALAVRSALAVAQRAGDAARAGERRFAALFDGSAEAVLVVEGEKVVQANPAAALLLGSHAADDLVGETYADLVPHRKVEGSSTTYGSKGLTREVVATSRDGRELVLQVREARILIDNRLLVQAILHDRTMEAERERHLLAAREAADQAARAKEAFLAMASHELRTPLNGVIGMASLLCDRELPEEALDEVRTIRVCADILLSLVNDLLDLTRLEAKGMPLERIAFVPRLAVEEAVATVAATASAKGLTVEVVAGTIPTVIGDPTRLRQVIINLVANAVKFTENGGVRVVLSAVALHGEGRTGMTRLAVAVEDTGIGIPKESIAHLFQPFHQADEATTRRFGGTGLGLAISQRLVELMGGTIEVVSEAEYGSVFSFAIDLPLAGSVLVPTEGRLEPSREFGGLRVLVVDDTESNRAVITAMLSLIGCEPVAVADGQGAIEAFTAEHFPLVLMDGMLDGMDGFETTSRLRAIEAAQGLPRSAILGLSAMDAEVEAERIRSCGMDAFLAKPITIDQLRSALLQYLQPQR